MSRWQIAWRLALAVLAGSGCGAKAQPAPDAGTAADATAPSTTNDPPSLTVFTRTDEGCALSTREPARPTLTPRPGERVVVGELALVDECTGAGGQHVLLRATDGATHFLGAHACRTWEPDPIGSGTFGVLVGAVVSPPERPREGACVRFPGSTAEISSELRVRAIAAFATRADAEALGRSLAR